MTRERENDKPGDRPGERRSDPDRPGDRRPGDPDRERRDETQSEPEVTPDPGGGTHEPTAEPTEPTEPTTPETPPA